ncbi:HTH-type transcriptional regulator LutR [Sporomusa carbonis]|uniref:FadR/GntR family transcriptional regulator n=1 Tax=Sporomusa carbonis TaxID=3076075 RepID=UPI003A785AEF
MLEEKAQQVKKVLVTQNVTQQLIDLIMNGTILPGEKLPTEKQLMEIFGVGRSSLREAMRALVALGLIEVRVPEGTFVSQTFGEFFTKQLSLMSKISFDNITELIEARIAIETDVVELATMKVTPEDVENLNHIMEMMKKAQTSEEHQKIDLEFHNTLAKLSRNSFMYETMKILHGITAWWIGKVAQIESASELATVQHENIVKAIQTRDVNAASEAMKEHLYYVSDLLVKVHKLDEHNKMT